MDNKFELEKVEPAKIIPATRPLPFGYEQRLHDLKRHVEREADLLNAYQEQLTYEGDPRRLRKIEYEISRQKATIWSYLQEAVAIQTALPSVTTPETDAIQTQLLDMNQQLSALSQQIENMENRLADGQRDIREAVGRRQETILTHIATQHRQTIAILVNKMDHDRLTLTEILLDAAEQQQIAKWEAEQLIMLTQQALLDLKRLRQNQPEVTEWNNMLDALASQTGWDQKLKLTIPLIPGLVEFESEMGMDVVPALKQAWERVANKIQSLRGGQ